MMFLNLKGPRGAMPRRWRYQSRRAAARFLLKLRLWFAVAVLVHREAKQVNHKEVLEGKQADKEGKEEIGARKHKPNTKSRVMAVRKFSIGLDCATADLHRSKSTAYKTTSTNPYGIRPGTIL